MAGLIERGFLLGLGALTLTREKVTRFVDELVREGEVKPEESKGLVDKLVAKGEEEREELRKLIREEVRQARAAVTPASRQDIEELSQKIDELAAKLEGKAAKPKTEKE